MAASDEAEQSRRCQCARADWQLHLALSRLVATRSFQRACAPPHSRFPVPRREAPAAQLAAEFRNQVAPIRRSEGTVSVGLWRSKSKDPRPNTSVAAHCKGSARQEDQVRAASDTHASG